MSHSDSINVHKHKAGTSEGRKPDLQESIKTSLEVGLVDIYGVTVRENTDYLLEIYDRPDDVLKFEDDADYMELYATYRLNKAKRVVVRYTLIDGIHYLTRKDCCLQVGEHGNEVTFKEEKPEKQNILEFHATENNTFKILQRDKKIWLTWDKLSINYTGMFFQTNDNGEVYHKPVELLLRKKSIDIRDSIDILIPEGFDIASIDKCMMDYESNFISYDNEEAISSRLGSNFIVLHNNHFIAYAGKNHVKCDYNCRNRIIKQLCPSKGDEYYAEWIANDCHLKRIDGIIHNTIPPYMLFTNDYVREDDLTSNTIISGYTSLDPQNMVENIKSRSYNYSFFGCYFEEVYSFWLSETLENFGFELPLEQEIGYFLVERLCSSDFNGSLPQLKSDLIEFADKQQPDPSIRSPEFQLKDIEGLIVEENTDYYLTLYDHDLDVLILEDWHGDDHIPVHAASSGNGDTLIFRCSIINGIYHLLCNNKYLHFTSGYLAGISLMDQVPTKEQRLQFQVTKNNTFKIMPWNQSDYLKIEVMKASSCVLVFFSNGEPLELFLKRVSSQ
ncbi:hypothetical protein INT43_002960 [Umbelopsis isabellina]|uniref:Uncharacterized protein n=1 Tax=Mortierella isabellina TaxID=91625 RepID=A0A8H7U953_MORIS|nr:hypothetical protein INT43_002960 [Umbelopsis isabellina]